MRRYHSVIDELLENPNHGTILDGIGASVAIDSSGESIDLKGMDISCLNDGSGYLNTEHINPDHSNFRQIDGKAAIQWGTAVGRIVFAKKIFSDKDCESERELDLWNELELPFLYVINELYDNDGHSNARELAAIIRHYASRNLPILTRYSIEGSNVKRDGNLLLQTIARRIAVTVKPCNHSAISGLVASPGENAGHLELEKSEGQITNYKNEGLFNISLLSKAFTLGGSGGAPGTLTQGAATSAEQLKKDSFLKNQAKAAFRDWDRVTPFKTFLKHRLPDVSEDFIEKFSTMVDDYSLVKNESDWRVDQGEHLVKLNNSKRGIKKFRDKHVMPGEVEITNGPMKGSKLKMYHGDKDHVYVEQFKAGGDQEVHIGRMSRNKEGSFYKINKHPEEVKVTNHIDGDKHVPNDLIQSIAQKKLIHGIDMNNPIDKPYTSTLLESEPGDTFGWYRSKYDKLGLVKPSIKSDHDDLVKEGVNLSTARREAIYHNVAHDFWGLGQHVPTTALFISPDNGKEHSVIERLHDSKHVNAHNSNDEHLTHLKKMGMSGDLDKLAIMDTVMGNKDRNQHNYMVSSQHPHVHLIDNALIFNHASAGNHIPHYLLDYHNSSGTDVTQAHISQNTSDWLKGLDVMKLRESLVSKGVPHHIADRSSAILMNMQTNALLGKTKLMDIIHGHRPQVPVTHEVA